MDCVETHTTALTSRVTGFLAFDSRDFHTMGKKLNNIIHKQRSTNKISYRGTYCWFVIYRSQLRSRNENAFCEMIHFDKISITDVNLKRKSVYPLKNISIYINVFSPPNHVAFSRACESQKRIFRLSKITSGYVSTKKNKKTVPFTHKT